MSKSLSRIVFIYGLADPISGNVRYIGKSVNPKARLIQHLRFVNPSNHKEYWLNSLKKLGLVPEIVILETTSQKFSSEAEIFWIAKYRSEENLLTNVTEGGEGGAVFLGRKHSEISKMKLSIYRTGKKHSQETLEKMSRSHKDRAPWNKGIKVSNVV